MGLFLGADVRKWGVAIGLILALASPALADWRQARTDHFILTIDDSEEGAREFAIRLERFDAALRNLYDVGNSGEKLRPITIYAFGNDLFNATCRCPGALAYYRPLASGSFILTQFVPKVDRKAKIGGWSTQALLLHEYTHHFTFSNFPIAYPMWFQEVLPSSTPTAASRLMGRSSSVIRPIIAPKGCRTAATHCR